MWQRHHTAAQISNLPAYCSESSIHRLRSIGMLENQNLITDFNKRLLEVAFDHLNYSDFDALNQSFLSAMTATPIGMRDVSDMVSRYVSFKKNHQSSASKEQLTQLSSLCKGVYSLITQQDIQVSYFYAFLYHPLTNVLSSHSIHL